MQPSSPDLANFLAHEKMTLGYEPKDLKGNIFLKTGLSHLWTYLQSLSHNDSTHTPILEELELSNWTIYPKYLVDKFQLEKPELQASLQSVFQFLPWLKEQHSPNLPLENITHAIKFGQKEIERGLSIQKKLKEHLKKESPNSFQNLDLNSIEMELSWIQFQDSIEETQTQQGDYMITSRDPQTQQVFFNRLIDQKKVVTQLPVALFDLLQNGDQFYLEYEENQEGHQRLKKIQYLTPTPQLDL